MSTAQYNAHRPRVLCIDDDPAISTAISARLSGYDVEVVPAFFGTQGMWIAVTERPDAIITDMRMPQGEGTYVVECLKIRNDTRDIPLIVLTGNRDSELERRMLELGVFRYLHKPLQFECLLNALQNLLELQPADRD